MLIHVDDVPVWGERIIFYDATLSLFRLNFPVLSRHNTVIIFWLGLDTKTKWLKGYSIV